MFCSVFGTVFSWLAEFLLLFMNISTYVLPLHCRWVLSHSILHSQQSSFFYFAVICFTNSFYCQFNNSQISNNDPDISPFHHTLAQLIFTFLHCSCTTPFRFHCFQYFVVILLNSLNFTSLFQFLFSLLLFFLLILPSTTAYFLFTSWSFKLSLFHFLNNSVFFFLKLLLWTVKKRRLFHVRPFCQSVTIFLTLTGG